MIKALLLDMDGTLIDIDFGGFLDEYMRRVVARFPDAGQPEDVGQQLVSSTIAMIKNQDPKRTVLQAFIDDFFPALGLPSEAINVFHEFYQTEYKELHRWARPVPGARELIQAAFNKGLRVAVATAPMFPEVAIRERLRWGEVDHFDFDWVSGADKMHTSKPFPGYYLEIAERLGVEPEECIMVGDELLMDGAATRAGIRTLLVGPERPSNMELWFSGTLKETVTGVPRYADMYEVKRVLEDEGVL